MLHNEASLKQKQTEARQLRAEALEHRRRVQLAQFRDRMRRSKIANGLPIPDDLKEQPWERRIASGEVCCCVVLASLTVCCCGINSNCCMCSAHVCGQAPCKEGRTGCRSL